MIRRWEKEGTGFIPHEAGATRSRVRSVRMAEVQVTRGKGSVEFCGDGAGDVRKGGKPNPPAVGKEKTESCVGGKGDARKG